MDKSIVLKLMNEAKEKALQSKDCYAYMYSNMLSIIAHEFNFTEEEVNSFSNLILQQWEREHIV